MALKYLRLLALLISLEILELVYLEVNLRLKYSLKLMSKVIIELLEVILEAISS